MDNLDFNVSNGSCYWAANALTADDFIPCGNAGGVTNYACCQIGDKCLSSNACFNLDYGATYIIGCTDPDYVASSCPRKGDLGNQAVVGLTRCDPDKEYWKGCEQDGDTSELQPPDSKDCTCTGSADALFKDAATLANIAILPSETKGSISWFAGHTPISSDFYATSTSDADTTSTSLLGSASTSSSGSQSATSTSSSSALPSPSEHEGGHAGLTEHGAIGLGVGLGIGVGCGVLGLLVLGFRWMRGKKPPKYAPPGDPSVDHNHMEAGMSTPMSTPQVHQAAWTESKAELPADNTKTAYELDTPGVFAGPAEAPRPAPSRPPTYYTAYSPEIHGDYAGHNREVSGASEEYARGQIPRSPMELSAVSPVESEGTVVSRQQGAGEQHAPFGS